MPRLFGVSYHGLIFGRKALQHSFVNEETLPCLIQFVFCLVLLSARGCCNHRRFPLMWITSRPTTMSDLFWDGRLSWVCSHAAKRAVMLRWQTALLCPQAILPLASCALPALPSEGARLSLWSCTCVRSCAECSRTCSVLEHHRPGSSNKSCKTRLGLSWMWWRRRHSSIVTAWLGILDGHGFKRMLRRIRASSHRDQVMSSAAHGTSLQGYAWGLCQRRIILCCFARDVDQGACLLAMAPSFAYGWKRLRILAATNSDNLSHVSQVLHRNAEHLPSLRALSLGAWAVTHQARHHGSP